MCKHVMRTSHTNDIMYNAVSIQSPLFRVLTVHPIERLNQNFYSNGLNESKTQQFNPVLF